MDIHFHLFEESIDYDAFEKVGAFMNQVHLIAMNYNWELASILDLKSQDRIDYCLMIYTHLKAKYGADEDDFE